MANTFDCEPYLRALEEQADSIGGAANGLLQAMETFKENAASMVRTVENLKKMIGMTRRAMNLAHGGRVVERVEVKREPKSPSSSFNSTSRYLDDLLNIDNIHFEHMVHRIYPTELQLNKANASDTEAAFLDLNLSIHNDIVSTKI